MQDGSYSISYVAPRAGMYVMRLSLAEAGLNLTLFNTTTFGHLFDKNHNPADFSTRNNGVPDNLGTTLSWTGDQGGMPGHRGDLGTGTYYDKFSSQVVGQVSLDLTGRPPTSLIPSSRGNDSFRFRDEHWSAIYRGMITPLFAEMYTFSIEVDGDSAVDLRIGGVGNEFNQSVSGDVVLEYNASHPVRTGKFLFTDAASREIVLRYIHFTGDAKLILYWQSPSTPFR